MPVFICDSARPPTGNSVLGGPLSPTPPPPCARDVAEAWARGRVSARLRRMLGTIPSLRSFPYGPGRGCALDGHRRRAPVPAELEQGVHLADGLAQALLHAHLQHLLHLLEGGELLEQPHARAALVLEETH